MTAMEAATVESESQHDGSLGMFNGHRRTQLAGWRSDAGFWCVLKNGLLCRFLNSRLGCSAGINPNPQCCAE